MAGILKELLKRYEEYDADIMAEVAEINEKAEKARGEWKELLRKAEEMRSYAESYEKQAKSIFRPDWKVEVLERLGKMIAQKNGMHCIVSGPYGLGSRCFIILYEDSSSAPIKQSHKELCVQPWFGEDKLSFVYETGVITDRYAPGTIGYENGLNMEVKPLPDEFDEIYALFKDMPAVGLG